jgi:hypothetical protein
MRHNEPVIDYTDPATANQRLSHSERDDAVAALAEFAKEGRLTDAEAAQRSDTARSAVTRGDLAPLFADLPVSLQSGAQQTGAQQTGAQASGAQQTGSAQQANFGAPVDGDYGQAPYGQAPYGQAPYGAPAGPRQRPWRYAVVSLSPFVALALFFITGNVWGFNYAWLWFLLIPIAGIVTYGANGWGDHDRDRYRDR